MVTLKSGKRVNIEGNKKFPSMKKNFIKSVDNTYQLVYNLSIITNKKIKGDVNMLDRIKFNENEEYRNKVLQVLNSLCLKGINEGLNDEEEKTRIEINKIVNDYYFKR